MSAQRLLLRQPAVAGSFYPATRDALADALQVAFADSVSPTDPATRPKALIVPHAGYPYSGAVAASAYRTLLPHRNEVSRVVLVGPSHRVAFRGLAVSGADAWQTPLGSVPIDDAGRLLAAALDDVVVDDLPHGPEHSLEVQVPFLQTVLAEFALVPVVVGLAAPASVAALLTTLWGGPETLVVISTDLSHYETHTAARHHDARTVAAILGADAGAISSHDACGATGLRGLLHVVEAQGLTIEQLDVRNSGDTAGDRIRVVGYGSFAVR